MTLTCPLLHLFVLKLENHSGQELEILYRAGAQKINEYLLFFFFFWVGGGGGRGAGGGGV